jgi:putative thioredoxin
VRVRQGQVKLAKMNIDEHPAVAGQLGIQSIPAVVAFVNGQGRRFRRRAARKAGEGVHREAASPARPGRPTAEALVGRRGGAPSPRATSPAPAQIYRRSPQGRARNRCRRVAGLAQLRFSRPARSSAPPRLIDDAARLKPPPTRAFAAVRAAARPCKSPDRRARRPGDGTRGSGSPPTRRTTRRASTSPFFSMPRASARGPSDRLLEIVRKNRSWEEEKARKQLLQFFEAWGPMDEATLAGRRKLSSLLFR